MKVHQYYTDSPLRNFTYIIELEKELYCIDPWSRELVMPRVKELGKPLKAIINTHEHLDHICGNDEIQKETNCEIWCHENGEGKIPNVDRLLKCNEEIHFGKSKIIVMDTPGHTFAHLCLLLVCDEKPFAIITGDTLLNAGVGNCHNGGDPKVLFETVSNQLGSLADEVIIYPGHDYLLNNLEFTLSREPSNKEAKKLLDIAKNSDTTKMKTDMKVEREVNTFFRLENSEIKNNLDGDVSSNKQVFLRLRELRNNW